MWRYILLLTFCLFLVVPVFGQETKTPTVAELKKDLVIINLRIENMELRYRNLKALKERLEARVSQLKSSVRKKVDDEKSK